MIIPTLAGQVTLSHTGGHLDKLPQTRTCHSTGILVADRFPLFFQYLYLDQAYQ